MWCVRIMDRPIIVPWVLESVEAVLQTTIMVQVIALPLPIVRQFLPVLTVQLDQEHQEVETALLEVIRLLQDQEPPREPAREKIQAALVEVM